MADEEAAVVGKFLSTLRPRKTFAPAATEQGRSRWLRLVPLAELWSTLPDRPTVYLCDDDYISGCLASGPGSGQQTPRRRRGGGGCTLHRKRAVTAAEARCLYRDGRGLHGGDLAVLWKGRPVFTPFPMTILSPPGFPANVVHYEPSHSVFFGPPDPNRPSLLNLTRFSLERHKRVLRTPGHTPARCSDLQTDADLVRALKGAGRPPVLRARYLAAELPDWAASHVIFGQNLYHMGGLFFQDMPIAILYPRSVDGDRAARQTASYVRVLTSKKAFIRQPTVIEVLDGGGPVYGRIELPTADALLIQKTLNYRPKTHAGRTQPTTHLHRIKVSMNSTSFVLHELGHAIEFGASEVPLGQGEDWKTLARRLGQEVLVDPEKAQADAMPYLKVEGPYGMAVEALTGHTVVGTHIYEPHENLGSRIIYDNAGRQLADAGDVREALPEIFETLVGDVGLACGNFERVEELSHHLPIEDSPVRATVPRSYPVQNGEFEPGPPRLRSSSSPFLSVAEVIMLAGVISTSLALCAAAKRRLRRPEAGAGAGGGGLFSSVWKHLTSANPRTRAEGRSSAEATQGGGGGEGVDAKETTNNNNNIGGSLLQEQNNREPLPKAKQGSSRNRTSSIPRRNRDPVAT